MWLHEYAEKSEGQKLAYVYVIYVPISLEVCCRVSGPESDLVELVVPYFCST